MLVLAHLIGQQNSEMKSLGHVNKWMNELKKMSKTLKAKRHRLKKKDCFKLNFSPLQTNFAMSTDFFASKKAQNEKLISLGWKIRYKSYRNKPLALSKLLN